MSIKSNQEPAAAGEKTTAELHQVFSGAQDALTDEMVGRLVGALSDGAGLLDQLGRSGVDRAIPLLAGMIENGDLARIVQLARVVSAAQDSMTDEMVARLTGLISGAMNLLDRLNRTNLDGLMNALPQIAAMFDYLQQQHLIDDLAHSLEEATALAAASPPAAGGLKGLWAIAREPDTQEALRFLLLLSRRFRTCRNKRQATQDSG